MATKLLTAAGGGITLDAASTATDKTITIPAVTGTMVYVDASGSIIAPRVNSSSEGGQIDFQRASDATVTWSIDSYGNTSTPTLRILDGANVRMALDGSGNVGIGTSSPTFSSGGGLHVNVAGAGPSIVHLTTGNQGTTASDGLDVKFYAGDATLWNYETGYMAFATSNAERARIDSNGNLLVGTTSIATYTTRLNILSPSSLNAAIHCRTDTSSAQSQIIFGNATSANVGSISTSSSTTTYSTSSDYRLKENVQPMQGALATVAQLKPVTYTWKADGSNGQGFIAHELQAVVPDAVIGEKDAIEEDGSIRPQGIDTSFLVATLTAAIQELSAKNDALEARLAALENK